ncbi:MAG TPA: class I SAM-dependent methyltransferase [Solirubrobacterales bacterium]|jgi:SAM-dependent methyltransferase|nr:class I SAM-dependent methyltransferase [Solirubrobacterales bacterium]
MTEQPDLKAVTQVQQQIWSKGDFAMVANLVYNVSENLVEALDLIPDERVLDVACGSGNGAIAAARRTWGGTVGADYVPELLERGRERAFAERLEIEFVEADAQDLPFEDASFDVAISIYGAMFAPDQEKTAAELLRVVKPGGRIGMGNWCPDGDVGKMFGTIAKHAPPPAGIPSPLAWGTEERLRELFGDGISELRTERRVSRQPFRSADHYIEFFRTYFGPTQMAYERVGPEGEGALTDDLKALLEEANTAGDRAMVLEADYLEVIAVRA